MRYKLWCPCRSIIRRRKFGFFKEYNHCSQACTVMTTAKTETQHAASYKSIEGESENTELQKKTMVWSIVFCIILQLPLSHFPIIDTYLKRPQRCFVHAAQS